MPKRNVAREFEKTMRPQVIAMRELRNELHQAQGLSPEATIELFASKIEALAYAFEELTDAVADALDGAPIS